MLNSKSIRLAFFRAVVMLFATFALSCKHQSQNVDAPIKPSPTPTDLKAISQPSSTPLDLKAISQPSPITNKPYAGIGVVKLINREEGWIEIDHEDIPGLMPAMEMEWFVKKKSLLDHVAVGDKVNFTVVDTGKAQIITELKKAEAEKK
jgi:Cu/Ag efflux protein CusF